MKNFRTQRSPDLEFYNKIKEYVDENTPRVLLECGANDGINGSPGFYFETMGGWECINIEANPDAYHDLVYNRPNCLNLNFGLSSITETIKFVYPIDGPNNHSAGRGSFTATQEEFLNRKIKEVLVTCRRLDDICLEHNIEKIGIFILDVEGYESKVLNGMSNLATESYPHIFVIEDDKDTEIVKLIEKIGFYKLVGTYKNNSIYKKV